MDWGDFSASINWNIALPLLVIAVTLVGILVSMRSARYSEKGIKHAEQAVKYAEQAVKYARHAWLDPVPKFDCLSKRAEFFELDKGGYLGRDGQSKKDGYVFKIDMQIQNISNIPAPIRDIHINDFVLSADGSKETKVRISVPEKLIVRCTPQQSRSVPLPRYKYTHSSLINITPNATLDGSMKGLLRVVIAFEDVPKKIKVNIHTPNRERPFPFIIERENIREETNEGNACDWFK